MVFLKVSAQNVPNLENLLVLLGHTLFASLKRSHLCVSWSSASKALFIHPFVSLKCSCYPGVIREHSLCTYSWPRFDWGLSSVFLQKFGNFYSPRGAQLGLFLGRLFVRFLAPSFYNFGDFSPSFQSFSRLRRTFLIKLSNLLLKYPSYPSSRFIVLGSGSNTYRSICKNLSFEQLSALFADH